MNAKYIGLCGLLIVGFYVFIALFAPILAPFDASSYKTQPFLKPDSVHILGTNDIGQDIFSELLIGARLSLTIGFIAAMISITVGVLFGVAAGWFGGIADHVLSAVCAFFMTIPFFPLVIIIAGLVKAGPLSSAVILGALGWTEIARILRAQTLQFRSCPYIQDIQVMGAGSIYILLTHILRSLFPMIAYHFILRYRGAILAEAALSFLGLGSPLAKSWGTMLYYAQARNAFITGAWKWWILPPGFALSGLLFAFVMICYYFEETMLPAIRKKEVKIRQ